MRIVKGHLYGPATEEFIRKRIQEQFDSEAVVEFEIAERIEREASGKMRLIKRMGAD